MIGAIPGANSLREVKTDPLRRRWRRQTLETANSYYGLVAGAGAVAGSVCGDVFKFGAGRPDSVVVGAFSVVLAPGALARSLAKSSQAPMAISAAMISSGSTFQSPSSVRVAWSQAVLLRGAPSPSVSGSSLLGGRSFLGLCSISLSLLYRGQPHRSPRLLIRASPVHRDRRRRSRMRAVCACRLGDFEARA